MRSIPLDYVPTDETDFLRCLTDPMWRGLRDNQQDVHKRFSKALHILSTSKTIMDEGAVPDLDAFVDEVSRPDAVIVKKAGKQLEINADRDLGEARLELMARWILIIQSASGVTDKNMGRWPWSIAVRPCSRADRRQQESRRRLRGARRGLQERASLAARGSREIAPSVG